MYLTWNRKTITDFSDKNINSLYGEGYVFTRLASGRVDQTRSVRIDLAKFKLSSENRRVLKKTESVELNPHPIPYAKYDWSIHKMGKDFYENKFGKNTFSAQKIKELITDEKKSNFNVLLIYRTSPLAPLLEERVPPSLSLRRGAVGGVLPTVGYAICRETDEILHYCYPFYNLSVDVPNLGLGMMIQAILYAEEHGKKYVYLGSAQRPTDTYKFQFAGLEWFDGKKWQTDLEELKNVLKSL